MNNLAKTLSLGAMMTILMTAVVAPANATWSVVAVDRDSGEIGIAGASCTFDVSGIASVVPKKGAIVVQAASNYFARMKGVELMRNDATVEEIMVAMKAEKFTPERQQYAVVSVKGGSNPLVYSGSEIKDWSGSKTDQDFAVLGNILVGEKVISSAYQAFEKERAKPLVNRLMAALSAGAKNGGDNRCGEQKARSAFISVYNPIEDSITTTSVYGIELGGEPAVALLQQKFDLLYGTYD